MRYVDRMLLVSQSLLPSKRDGKIVFRFISCVFVLPVRFMCPPIGNRRPNRAQAAADEAADRLAASGALTAVASSAQLAALNAAARAGLRAAAAPPTEVQSIAANTELRIS